MTSFEIIDDSDLEIVFTFLSSVLQKGLISKTAIMANLEANYLYEAVGEN